MDSVGKSLFWQYQRHDLTVKQDYPPFHPWKATYFVTFIKNNSFISLSPILSVPSMIPGSATGSDPSPVLTFSDYISRMEEDPDNMVAFDKGEDLAYCRILIIDDSLYEEDETFQVMLSNPMGGRIGNPSLINVIISGDSDDGKYQHGQFVKKLCV